MIFEHDDAIRSKIRRARVVKVDDSGTQQKLNLRGLASDRPEEIVRVLDFGFGSHPVKDGEGVLVGLGGRSDRLMFMGGEHKDHRRKNLPEGTAVLYDKSGNIIFAKAGDGLAIHAKAGKVYVKPADGQKVYLGGDGTDGNYAKVMTEDGPSVNVYAKV
jgi:phage gp45-like